MKKILSLFSLLFSLLSATIINIPTDYSTIQEGINASVDGDTVLVADGTYYENLIIDKDIMIGSHFILNGSYSHRNATIIDGSHYDEDSGPFGSCVLFLPPENGDHIHPRLTGFTIQNGLGTRVRDSSGDETITYYIGGGLMIWYSMPEITHNYIRENGNNSDTRTARTKKGGGGKISYDDDIEFDEDRSRSYTRTVHNRDDEIIFSKNVFENNNSESGNTLQSIGYVGNIDISDSYFDVFSTEYEDVSIYWIDKGDADTDFTGGSGELEAITDAVWVGTDGVDETTTTGTEADPFKTIDHAMSRTYGTANNPITINLTGETFSPSTTGEVFPIRMISNVNLIGQGEESTILDAEQTDRVIKMVDCQNNIISNLTITGGVAQGEYPDYWGGGMYLDRSDPILTNVTISENTAIWTGGGMDLHYSNPTLTHVTISENTAIAGGGMNIHRSDPILTNVTISENTASWGGGIYLINSAPILSYVTISGNTAVENSGGGIGTSAFSINSLCNLTLIHVTISGNTAGTVGGMFLNGCDATLTNVTISENTAITGSGGGTWLYNSNSTFTNVTISGNTANSNADEASGVMKLIGSNVIFTNSIIWGNSPEEIYFNNPNFADPSTITINYSDIQGGEEGINTNDNGEVYWLEGNIDANPLFTDPDNGDLTLQEGSPCIDSGDPNLWFEGMDGTTGDMGVTGGLFVLPNFISHDFGEVGDNGIAKQFSLYNFRETAITISSVSFNTSSFTTNTSFPLTIDPFQSGIINIEVNNSVMGEIEDEMIFTSNDLPEGISVSLSVTAAAGDILNGNLSGTYPAADYRITGDLDIANGETVYLSAGTKFLFDGQYHFNIYGTLKAIGTEPDSIIFDNFGEEKWQGFTLDNVSDETEFRYVRISGAEKTDTEGGGMYLDNSDPTLTHVNISGNTAGITGGGMHLSNSNPILTNVTISENTASYPGGGMWLHYSNPTLTHVTISGNTTSSSGGGMVLLTSNPILTHVVISENTAEHSGGGLDFIASNPILTDVTISGNTAVENFGGGMTISGGNPILTNVTISGNTAEHSGGGGLTFFNESNLILINSIIWDNSPESIYFFGDYPSTISIQYSDIEGGEDAIVTNDYDEVYWLEGNIDIDPLFTDPENGDYTLQEGSPCIDAGTADLDGDGEDDIEYVGAAPDMGAFEYGALVNVDETKVVPESFTLHQNYPNPFNPTTILRYNLPEQTKVTLTVYDMLGRQVTQLVNTIQGAGYRSVQWNATNNQGQPVSAGVYLYSIEAGDFRQTKKMILLK